MSKVCQVTGKKPRVGQNVSHANNKTKRRFLTNLHYRKIWVEELGRFVRLRLTAHGLRTLEKVGVMKVLEKLKAQGEKF